jgi:Ca-activated chloride channel homolog
MHSLAVRRPFFGFIVWLALVLPTVAQQTTPQPQQSTPDAQAAAPQGSSETPGIQDAYGNGQQGMFVFKKQVEEVVLHATVVDEQGRLATHLDQSSFTIFENGTAQTITSFRREDVPVAMGIVIDNSGSMRDKRDRVNQAVLNLIRASNPQDEIFVVNFSQNSYLDQDFTSNIGLLEHALHQVSMRGSTALYDAVTASAIHLENDPRLEKKVLLVITDGQDNMSEETLQQVARRLQQSKGPALYAIGLMGIQLQGSGREALEKLANATGGSAFFPDSLDEVSEITFAVSTRLSISHRMKM